MTASQDQTETLHSNNLDAGAFLASSWCRADWQRLWLGTQTRPWRTLAVIAGDGDTSSFEVASLITGLGLQHGQPTQLADVRNVSLNRVDSIIRLAGEVIVAGDRIVFAARSIAENLATIPIARFADCVLLCASLGSSSLALIEETVAQVGRDRFLGSVLLKNPGEAVVTVTPESQRLEMAR